jgi:hypothetical protein
MEQTPLITLNKSTAVPSYLLSDFIYFYYSIPHAYNQPQPIKTHKKPAASRNPSTASNLPSPAVFVLSV